jgi:hypothetical protein
MPTFLFWNINGKQIDELIVSLALTENVDVIVLAECGLDPNDFVIALNRTRLGYEYAPGLCERLRFFTRFDNTYLGLTAESDRVSIRRLMLPGRDELLLVAAHLPSKMHFSGASQIFQCVELRTMIEEQETKAGHRRTIVLADLNVNPFEEGVVAAGGLHAVTTRAVASRGQRVVQGTSYPFFYNPMWHYFGDRHESAPGTYYYEKAESLNYYWNIFDQILLRPDVLHGFRNDGVRVITQIDGQPLLDNSGKPDVEGASDHLPLLLTLHF